MAGESTLYGVFESGCHTGISSSAADRPKRGFNCPEGQLAYRGMGMRLKNGTHIFLVQECGI